jgi:hypothetical protein
MTSSALDRILAISPPLFFCDYDTFVIFLNLASQAKI